MKAKLDSYLQREALLLNRKLASGQTGLEGYGAEPRQAAVVTARGTGLAWANKSKPEAPLAVSPQWQRYQNPQTTGNATSCLTAVVARQAMDRQSTGNGRKSTDIHPHSPEIYVKAHDHDS